MRSILIARMDLLSDRARVDLFSKDEIAMKRTMWLAALGVFVIGGVPQARAQAINWEDRGFANLNFGYQTQSHTFDSTKTFSLYSETATVKAGHTNGSGAFLDLSGGMRVWRNAGVGIGYSRFQNTDDVTVAATLPHPAVFDQPRSVSIEAKGLEHTESAVHIFGLWMLPLSDKMDLAVFLGPTFYSVKQDVVTNVAIAAETPPFTSPVVTATKDTAKDSAVGVDLGVDWSYMVTPQVGGGIFLRYSGASSKPTVGDTSVSVDVGGFQIGVGLRVRLK
jgi:hypothetical protein